MGMLIKTEATQPIETNQAGQTKPPKTAKDRWKARKLSRSKSSDKPAPETSHIPWF
jgi:hypothetical protein